MLRSRKRNRLRSDNNRSSHTDRRSRRLAISVLTGLAGFVIDDLSKPESKIKLLYNNLRKKLSTKSGKLIPEEKKEQIEEIEVSD